MINCFQQRSEVCLIDRHVHGESGPYTNTNNEYSVMQSVYKLIGELMLSRGKLYFLLRHRTFKYI